MCPLMVNTLNGLRIYVVYSSGIGPFLSLKKER